VQIPFSIAVNPAKNKIYVANLSDFTVTVIDGGTNTTSAIAGLDPYWLAVNPVTGRIYVSSTAEFHVTTITEQQVQPIPLTTAIIPLADNQTTNPTPSFTFTANSTTITTPTNVFFQVDTWQGPWSPATGSDPSFSGTLAQLRAGLHILYAFAADGKKPTRTPLRRKRCSKGRFKLMNLLLCRRPPSKSQSAPVQLAYRLTWIARPTPPRKLSIGSLAPRTLFQPHRRKPDREVRNTHFPIGATVAVFPRRGKCNFHIRPAR